MIHDPLRAARAAAALALCLLLSACFVGKQEFIGAADAEFPYERITFTEVGRNEPTTLVKGDGAYRALEEDNPVAIRLKKLATDLYLAQASGDEGGKKTVLFAVLKVDNRSNTVKAFKAVADEDDKAPGLTPCNDDSLCLDALKPYVDYALAAIAAGAEPDAVYRILSVQ